MQLNNNLNEFKVSVVLPSYNERDSIVEAINRINNAVGEQLLEIIIVDDNSPDLTWKLLEELNHPKVKLIRRINEKGLASSLDDGIRAAQGDVIVWLDADLGLSPEEIPGLVSQLNKYDVAIGSRYVKGGKDPRPAFRVFVSILINLYAMTFLGFGVRDYTSGFAAVRKEVFDKVHFSRKGFGEYFIDFAYKSKKAGYKIIEMPCVYQVRSGGVSKSDGDLGTLFSLGKDYGLRVLKLRFGKD
ncbi:glycosyltransferase [Candidatus Woesearchaeota archaeon]|jgi:dolichol-phosphate mannosyltransferase|nr:glycosyltransferase [Candidatus Woesearchaeota archaeon]MBT5342920.1 glycosyltransferase [Candidatus Woesearchaeota archaeon]